MYTKLIQEMIINLAINELHSNTPRNLNKMLQINIITIHNYTYMGVARISFRWGQIKTRFFLKYSFILLFLNYIKDNRLVFAK